MGGCAAERYRQEGLSLIKEGRLEEGVSMLALAENTDARNITVKKEWITQRDTITSRLMTEGNRERSVEHWDLALQRFNRVLAIDPAHQAALQAIAAMTQERQQISNLDEATLLIKKGDAERANNIISRVLIESPNHARANTMRAQISAAAQNESVNGVNLNLKGRKPVTLQFRDANLRMVMEAISKTTGLNVMFDKDVKNDLKVTIIVRDTPVEEAIDLILFQTQMKKRVMSENSILIYQDTAAKAREYADLKIRRFGLTNADPKLVMAMIKTITKTKDMFVDEKTNALVIRDTPQVIRLIERLVATMDQPDSEVMLEVNVMEVSTSRIMELGINWPSTLTASTTGMNIPDFRKVGLANFVLGGDVVAKAKNTDDDINYLATPRIRVRNKEKAKFLVGDRLPVISTAAVPSSTSTTPVYNTNVQYVEVGIKIEVEPTIYPDGEVAIRLTLEVSSNGGQNAEAAKTGTIAYTVSTRSVNTVLRLKDGQTEILGGLIQNQDKVNATRVPGLGDIPLLGRLFGAQSDDKNKKEIVLSITPRIVRNNHLVDNDYLEMWSGTENNLQFITKISSDSKTPTSVPAAAAPATATPAATSPAVRPPAIAGAKPVAVSEGLKAVSMAMPPQAKPGDNITLGIRLPALRAATDLELNLGYDATRLRLLSINDGASESNAKTGARFSSTMDQAGVAHIQLTSGKGETLSTSGDALADLRFEVLSVIGATQVHIDKTTLKNSDGTEQILPVPAPATLEVKPTP
jgi:general secretion pathway protein D